ncbi:MAG: glycoside hydrolase family 16 protein, partial [Pseudonocardia sp.]|nr:glycoside hydrolase family 16 protein [Pseudonocardia sp.]
TDTGDEEAPTGDGDDGDRPAPQETDGTDPDPGARGPAGRSVPDLDADATDDSEAARTNGGGSEGVTAAERLGWGSPDREDDFTVGSSQWDVYAGPGHAGEGRRSPDAVSISDGVLVLTGDSAGTTAGMSWGEGQMYGRWEGRVRAPASDPSYNALMLLWPDAEDFPVGGEIDFMEMLDPTRQETDFFLHFGEDNEQVNGRVEVDGTRWHNWAVEWTPDAITAYVDGEEWFRTTDPSTFPPGPMHLCIQLDWFPEGSTQTVQESRMEVDWVRRYPLDQEPIVGDTVGTGEAGAEEQTVEQADAPVTAAVPDPLGRLFPWGCPVKAPGGPAVLAWTPIPFPELTRRSHHEATCMRLA